MKKVIILVIIILVGGFLFYTQSDKFHTKTDTDTTTSNDKGDFHPDPSNATFIFDDGAVTLSGGRKEVEVAPGSAFMEEFVLQDKFAYGDVNADGKEDTALLLVRYGAGSGTFIYTAVFVSGPVNYKGSNAMFIGDRISPQSISVESGVVTVKYLDRGPDEAFAAEPTIQTTKQFVYKNGELQEK